MMDGHQMENTSENKLVDPKPLPNILLVDDKPANLMLLEKMLTARGYKARLVLSGKLALEAARDEAPDLVILDINMPEMNGYEVCEKLKSEDKLKDIPVVFVSALDETTDKVKAFRVGGVDYITKPFQLEEVEARVQMHLKLRRLHIEMEMQNRDIIARKREEANLRRMATVVRDSNDAITIQRSLGSHL